MKKFTFQEVKENAIDSHQRANHATRNKPQKMNMRVTTSQYETSGKNRAHLLSHNLPAGEKIHWNKQ